MVERDVERMKRELAAAKADLEAVKLSLVQQVADAKVQIGDQAIEKMYKVFNEFRSWAVLGIALLVTVGGLSFYQLYTSAQRTIESKITDWLSFDKKGALLKESLENIRMRVVLDALVTKMTRSNLTESYRNLELSSAEKSRLIAYMLDPDTSETDFRDGARVLGAYVGIFYAAADTKLDELLSKTMSRFQADNYRPRVLLETLKRYQGIGQYANGILESKDAPDDLREAAFNALTGLFSDRARKYAISHLPQEQYGPLQDAEAKVLAGEPSAVSLVEQWISKKTAQGSGIEARVLLADVLAPGSSSIGMTTPRQQWMTNRSAELLTSAISKGAKLTFDDNFLPRVELTFRPGGSAGFRNPEYVFSDNNALMAAMVKSAEMTSIPADAFVRALTTKGRRGEVFGLSVILNSAYLVGETFGRIDTASTAGPLLLVSNDRSPSPFIEVSFRAKDGRWVTDHVTSFNGLYGATINFAYDRVILQMASAQNIRNLGAFNE
jgi:hypothetical protein